MKSEFPYNFVNDNNLNYIGDKPERKFYENISEEIYNKIPSHNWSVKDNTLSYLKDDLEALLEVLLKFNKDIFKLEKINITKVSTISSIAFKALMTNYIPKNTLNIIKGVTHTNMRQAYYGGVTEVYHLKAENKVYVYDINSSYPASMLLDMPTGNALMSTDPDLYNYFGIVYVRVWTPRNPDNSYKILKYPPLPFKTQDERLINPIGYWEGMYCSEILKYVVEKYGYVVQVLYGYKFTKTSNLFESFINKYYNIKSGKSNNININRSTAKLLLNSAYGRMGMKIDNSTVEYVDEKKLPEIESMYVIKTLHQVTEKKYWVTYDKILNNYALEVKNIENVNNEIDLSVHNLEENEKSKDVEQSLPVAIFTTAYSTIRLFEAIKTLEENYPDVEIYAVDTDSIHTNKPLPDYLVGDQLGQWKLEFIGDYGIYPIPKTYYLKGHKIKDGNILPEIVEIKKGKGVKSESITFEEYEDLLNGLSISKNENRFIIARDKTNVKYDNVNINITSMLKKRINNNDYSTKPLLVEKDTISEDY